MFVRRPMAAWTLLGVVFALLASGCGTSRIDAASVTAAANPRIRQLHVYRVPSESMEPTLPIGTKVTVTNGPLIVGAIVVFHPSANFVEGKCGPKPHIVKSGGAACDAAIPETSRFELIKRIVAGPGDEIYIRQGHVYRKAAGSGRFLRESDSYTRLCGASPECDFPSPIRIAAGYWFLMGDNRGASDDSRLAGPVPASWIVGTASRSATHG